MREKTYNVTVHSNGTKHWYLNGQLHREDGPAIEWSDGTKYWYHNGQRHREDGPAIEWADGDKEWYHNGQRHREDGPAIEWSDGTKEWYLNGKEYTEAEWKKKLRKKKLSMCDCTSKTITIDGKKYKLVEID